MLVTNRGQLIRTPVNDIRIAGRATQGVTLFRVEDGERVMSVTRLGDENDTEGTPGNGGEGSAIEGGNGG
jgi:DNA gyrase subunit A